MLASEEVFQSMWLVGHEEPSKGVTQISQLLGNVWSLLFVYMPVFVHWLSAKKYGLDARLWRQRKSEKIEVICVTKFIETCKDLTF